MHWDEIRFVRRVENQRVVIVGPSPHLLGSGSGRKIDSCDIVVRLNHALPVPEHLRVDYGSRTDILYTTLKSKSLPTDLKLLKSVSVVCPYAPVPPFGYYMSQFDEATRAQGLSIPFIVGYGFVEYREFEKRLGTRPVVGLAALQHLLDCGVANVYLTGLTFCKSVSGREAPIYLDEYVDKHEYHDRPASETNVRDTLDRMGVHDMDKHLSYVRQLLLTTKRVSVDDALYIVLEAVS